MPYKKRKIAEKRREDAEKQRKRKALYFQLCELFDTDEESEEENLHIDFIIDNHTEDNSQQSDTEYEEFDQDEDSDCCSDSDSDDLQYNDDLKIHPDSDLTVHEVALILVKWMISNKITKKAMNQLLTILNACIPSANFTNSTYKLIKCVTKPIKDILMKPFYVCCNSVWDTKMCNTCGRKVSKPSFYQRKVSTSMQLIFNALAFKSIGA